MRRCAWSDYRGRLLLGVQLLAVAAATVSAAVPAAALAHRHHQAVSTRSGLKAAEQGVRVAQNSFVALSNAKQLGQSVIVGDQTTKTTTVLANPDGTLTSLVADGPVQEPDASSPTGYSPIDTSLVAGLGGYVPTRADTSVTFSDGSDSMLASMSLPGKAGFQMQWGGKLPAPTVSGSTITYADVQPGVDIEERALPTGFDFRIVLTRRPSGDLSFSLPLDLTGVTASVDKEGRFILVDDSSGRVLAASDVARMWSADTTPDTGEPSNVQTVAETVAAGDTPTLTITPSTQYLQDPKLTYPVTIDPSTNLSATVDTYVDQANPSTSYASDTLLKAGLAGSGDIQRSLLQFDSSSLSGVDVLSASLNLYESHADSSCTASGLQAWSVSSSWTSAVTWATQPSQSQMYATSSTNAGGGSSCPAGWVSLSSGGSGSNTITSLVQSWANGSTNNGIQVAAGNETSTSGYKQFSSNEAGTNAPYLAVNYNSYPTNVTGRVPGPSALYVETTTPTLKGYFNDPDEGSGQVQFQIATSGGTTIDTQLGTSVPNGGRSSWQVPGSDGLTDGTMYEWRARGYDGTDYGNWSNYITFTVDATPPSAPTISSTTDPNQSDWYSSTAFTGSWTASTDAGSGVAGYAVSVSKGATGIPSGALQTSTTYSTTVGANGRWYLHVRPQDVAGNWGATATFEFNVGNGTLLSPNSQDVTQQYFTLQAFGESGDTGATFQYRRSPQDSWSTIPIGDVYDLDTSSSPSAWPVGLNGSNLTDRYRWNVASTLGGTDGPVVIRVQFAGTPGGSTGGFTTALNQNDLGAGLAEGDNEAVGPGSVNLVTGDLALTATDATVTGMQVDRQFDSLAPSAGSSGVFGPGWSSSVNFGTYIRLHQVDTGSEHYVVLYGGDDTEYAFAQLSADGTYPVTFKPAVGDPELTLTETSAGVFTVTDTSGDVTTFTQPSGSADYYPATTVAPNNLTSGDQSGTIQYTYSVVGGVTRPAEEIAPAPSGVSCTSAPLTTTGCDTLSFSYATTTTATGTGSSQWGDYAGQVKQITYTAYDPVGAAMTTVAVADYLYDSTGHLRAVWDPRITPALKTTYAYDGAGRVTTLTPPGLNAWTLNYNSSNQLTSTVVANDPSGTETTTVVYGVPLSGTGAPYAMSAGDTANWAQQDNPVAATAIFPATEVPTSLPPADYDQATIYYLDSDGNLVNIAAPGGEITTSEYDGDGNLVRTLSAGNRATALATGSTTQDHAAASVNLDDEYTYDANDEVTDEYGPEHYVTLRSGDAVLARSHTQYVYNTSGAPTTGGPYLDLPTTMSVGVLEAGGSSDTDVQTSTYQYDGQSNLGWTLRKPTSMTTDPSGVDLVSTTKYDNVGDVTETRQPANPSGGDAHSTQTTYYIAGTGSGVSSCDSHPEFAGLVCQVAPAAQPSGSLPAIPTTTYTYDMWGNVLTRTDTSGATVKTTTYEYDAAGRLTKTTFSGPGTSVPAQKDAYSTITGLPSTTKMTVSGTTTTISRGYDALGRLASYSDADGNSSAYTYDIMNRPSTFNDGKETQTYSYNTTTDPRGLLTGVSDSGVGTFAATYNDDGQLATETYPGGITRTDTYDATGLPVERVYTSGGTKLLDYAVGPSSSGQVAQQSGPLASRTFAYDFAGRLTQVQYSVYGKCSTRVYGYDADSNRTSQTAYPATTGTGACQTTTGGVTQSHSFDAADRLTDTGVSYDAMGRVTAIPATDTGAGAETLTYFRSGSVASIAAGGITETATLDPDLRLRTWATSANSSATQTYHYSGDGDSPAWIVENTAGTGWTRYAPGADGAMGASEDAVGSVSLMLADLGGNLSATASTAGLLNSVADYDEFGAPTTSPITARYGYLGAAERTTDGNSGLVLMGARVYSPVLGRFLQVDPVAGGSANPYDYANQDPASEPDPSGAAPMGAYCDIWVVSGETTTGGHVNGSAGWCNIAWDRDVVWQMINSYAHYTASSVAEEFVYKALKYVGIDVPGGVRFAISAAEFGHVFHEWVEIVAASGQSCLGMHVTWIFKATTWYLSDGGYIRHFYAHSEITFGRYWGSVYGIKCVQ